MTVSNQQHNSWADLIRANFDQTMKKMVTGDVEIRKALPVNLFSELGQSKEMMTKMINKVAEAMKEDE